ncbi:glycoside hydrolase family 3 N-terminal domain-containing protein [Fulvivirga sediminis]|uniref:Glycoside hydrolase family 3 C-terminal domain-containing protein n=1 Tax=Fulvivirga sediminis TaxID=2803949 RepID=A0A937F509_9BACT|nr:glycoside hydrolase family 3 N-terminal domain-containing protein [Fulvivirga sediminis]MBL3655880.1 glycoside hydrolase family 3 C-terminal domain-containing protein [Fulvivirga sediminis]
MTLNTIKKCFLIFLFFSSSFCIAQEDFRNPNLSTQTRVTKLLTELTVEEKISLMGYNNNGVERLGIPKYNWWNEGLHGVARAGNATVFPQAIAMAATFNDELVHEVADVISTEARAKYNLAVAKNRHLQYMGLSFWSPNINLFRDPRWGRGQETYGEDPFLTSQMGLAFMNGLQGDDPNYLKVSSAAKHLAVHSGPEADRHKFNAIVDEKDLRETYLYAFEKLVDGGVESIMCAYNRVNGEPCCTSETLLEDILKGEWNFQGHIVTDCWALEDIYARHKVMGTATEVAVAAVKAGVNLDCSNLMQAELMPAIEQGLLTEEDLDKALAPNLITLFKLGFFDDASLVPFSKLGRDDVHNTQNITLSKQAAEESMVLLKNADNLLPLNKEEYGSMVVVGSNSGSLDAMLGNYHGISSNIVTYAEGITAAAGPETAVQYDLGSNYTDTTHFGGEWAAENSDLTIAVIGLTPVLEGEEGDAFLAANGGDKKDLSIPAAHIAYLKALRAKHNKPIITVVTAGSAVDISAIETYSDAIIFAWYSGEQGGNALADIIFGETSPSGKLPITFYKSFDDLPPYASYDMKGRTYRYFEGDVQYPFGYGLTYGKFTYEWKKQPAKKYKADETIEFSLKVSNSSEHEAKEVVQAYIQYPEMDRMPIKELRAFKKIKINANGEETVSLSIPASELRKWDLKKGKWKVYSGTYKVILGSDSKDEKLVASFSVK